MSDGDVTTEVRTEVTDGVATARFTFEPTLATDHTGVTAGSLPTSLMPSAGVPDALVGAAWPTVFAVLGQTRRPRGTGRVVEGLLDLVHLDHGIRMHAALPQETTDLVVVARSGGVRDTDLGRVVEVFGDDPGHHVGHQHVQALGGQLASHAHALEALRPVDSDLAGAMFGVEDVGHGVRPRMWVPAGWR